MKGLFLDAGDTLADVFDRMVRPDDPPITVNRVADVAPHELPALLAEYDFVLDDHSAMPTDVMRSCGRLKHVIFLGTGARSYMNPEDSRRSASPCTRSKVTATLRSPSTRSH